LKPARYRKHGQAGGRAALALVPAVGGRAALEALVGPLSFFAFVEPAPDQPAAVPEPRYRGVVVEPPPADMLSVGAAGRRVAVLEVPSMGRYLGARAVLPAGLGPWLLVDRPLDDWSPAIPHPAFLPPGGGSEPSARVR
jgi:hypothetical protein